MLLHTAIIIRYVYKLKRHKFMVNGEVFLCIVILVIGMFVLV